MEGKIQEKCLSGWISGWTGCSGVGKRATSFKYCHEVVKSWHVLLVGPHPHHYICMVCLLVKWTLCKQVCVTNSLWLSDVCFHDFFFFSCFLSSFLTPLQPSFLLYCVLRHRQHQQKQHNEHWKPELWLIRQAQYNESWFETKFRRLSV